MASSKSRTNMPLSDCRIINLPKIADQRGNLTFIESARHVPFEIRRVFYLYDVPGGADRGGHALRTCGQFVIALSGSFDVLLDDGMKCARYRLDRPYFGLYICPMIWRELVNFSSGAVCLVLASNLYDPADYYRDYDQFLEAVRNKKPESGDRRGES